jgi:hypothetical protein
MLADQLAEAVANLRAAVVAIHRLGRKLLRLPRGRSRFGKRADLLDRADADAVGLAQGPVDRPGLIPGSPANRTFSTANSPEVSIPALEKH